jgi:tetratricopeptide (TPR) repeat protein
MSSFENALGLHEGTGSQARMHLQIGVLLTKKGESVKALQRFDEALAIAEERDAIIKGQVHTNQSYACYQLGKYADGLHFAQSAVNVLKDAGASVSDIALAKKYYAINISYLGKLDESIRITHEILESLGEGDYWLKASLYNNLGVTHGYMGEIAKSIEYYEQAWELLDLVGDKRGKAVQLMNMGWALNCLGDFHRAEGVLKDSLHLFERLNDKFFIVQTYANLLDKHICMKEWSQAKEVIQKGTKLMSDGGSGIKMADFLISSSKMALYQGNSDKGYRDAKEALQIATEHGDLRYQGLSEHAIGVSQRLQRNHDGARTHLQKALEILKDQRLEGARVRLEMGINEIDSGDREKGLSLASKALEDFKQMGAKWDIAVAEKALKGDYIKG